MDKIFLATNVYLKEKKRVFVFQTVKHWILKKSPLLLSREKIFPLSRFAFISASISQSKGFTAVNESWGDCSRKVIVMWPLWFASNDFAPGDLPINFVLIPSFCRAYKFIFLVKQEKLCKYVPNAIKYHPLIQFVLFILFRKSLMFIKDNFSNSFING